MSGTRRIMRAFKMSEISAVDRPAQIGARATILKRDDRSPPDGSLLLSKGIEDMTEAEVKKMIDDAVKAATADIAKLNAPTEAQITERINTAVSTAVAKAQADTRTEMEAEFKKREEIAKGDEILKDSDGNEIRKSVVGEGTFKFIKAQADKIEIAAFEKRAGDEIPHLPGTTTLKARCLRVVSKIDDKEVREGLEAMLKGGSAAVKTMTVSKGHDLPAEVTNAEDGIDKLAKELQKGDPKLSFEDAYAKALETPEGQRLYNEATVAKRNAKR
jgi:hypothetical protein